MKKLALFIASAAAATLSGCALQPYANVDAQGAEAGVKVTWQDLGNEIQSILSRDRSAAGLPDFTLPSPLPPGGTTK